MKFDTAVPIGRGGMGEVFKTHDPDLDRPVAIKLLHRSDEESVARMLNEARAQARLDHPNICKVYEVGELRGRPYIAMQLIEGGALDEAAADLPAEQKAALVRTVAEAVHAAHRAGLIHRDLKPANILVEEAEDGVLKPYVLDFGIAKQRDVEGFTVTGQVLGTPGYLSPEQARGEVHTLDRRSDVFSLGAILYQLLTGRAPFEAESSVATLVKLLQEEAAPIQKIAPHVPRDLATITEKCLEKERERRYPSARALAEDLGRFLEGEPIQARPATLVYRLYKRLRRHPVAAVAGTVALLAVVVFGGLALSTRLQASRQQQLAQQFGQRVERMESLLRLGHMAPRHDIRTDRALVEAEIERLELESVERGRNAAGPGNYAIGRGYLSLDRPEQAREHLEAAWRGGYRGPEVALALGRALGRLYSARLEAADQLADPELRRQQREEARLELADRAGELLGRAQAVPGEQDEAESLYTRALLAFYDGDLDRARQLAEEAGKVRSWFYEPHLLVGETSTRLAVAALESGEHQQAAEELQLAEAAYLAAAAIAPSDPRVYLGPCALGLRAMQLAADTAQPADAAYARTLDQCESALEVDAGLTEAIDLLSEAAWSMARNLVRRGEEPLSLLDTAAERARRSLALSDNGPRALGHLGNSHWVRAKWLADHNQDPFPTFDLAIESFERGLEVAPANLHLLMSLGHALNDRALWTSLLVNQDPIPIWRAAADAYERAIALSEQGSSRLFNGLCAVRNDMAYYLFQHGGDPGDLPDLAAEACSSALRINSDYLSALNTLGIGEWGRATYLLAAGADPGEAYERAAEAFGRILEISPGRPTASVNLANLLIEEAAWQYGHGNDPTPLLARAEGHNQAVEGVYQNDFHYLQSRLELLRGRAAAAIGSSPLEAFARAERHGEEAVRLRGAGDDLGQLAAVFRRRAEWRITGEAIDSKQLVADVATGLSWAMRASEADSSLARNIAHRAALEHLKALLAGTDAERESWNAAAEASKARALELRPDLASDLAHVP